MAKKELITFSTRSSERVGIFIPLLTIIMLASFSRRIAAVIMHHVIHTIHFVLVFFFSSASVVKSAESLILHHPEHSVAYNFPLFYRYRVLETVIFRSFEM